jgi:calcineurin-like phosphoesterase family protein
MIRFIVSDWHLGETRMEIMGRPFTDGNACIWEMVAAHNSVVAPDDLVYVLGDVCYNKTPNALSLVSKFNGKKILVRGNHDRDIPDSEFLKYFFHVVPDGGSVVIDCGNGLLCNAVHYPSEGKKDMFNLVGHIHSAWKYQLNMFNVGVDVNHYYPTNLDKIPFHIKAISEYYDEDVWVAYQEVNSVWRGKRGKAGTYFRPIQAPQKV